VSPLHYDRIEQQLVDALPELRPVAEHYWKVEGVPGTDCGPYVFFEDLVARYVEILLALPASERRDVLLRRAFAFVEEMLASEDLHVRDLASIGLLEGRSVSWLVRATPFVGPLARAGLGGRKRAGPLGFLRALLGRRTNRELRDGYGVRQVIADELRAEGMALERVPGTTYAADS